MRCGHYPARARFQTVKFQAPMAGLGCEPYARPYAYHDSFAPRSQSLSNFFECPEHGRHAFCQRIIGKPLVRRVGHAANHPVDKSGIAVDIGGEANYPETLLPNLSYVLGDGNFITNEVS